MGLAPTLARLPLSPRLLLPPLQSAGGLRGRSGAVNTRASTRASDTTAVASAVAQRQQLDGSRSLSTLLQKLSAVRARQGAP